MQNPLMKALGQNQLSNNLMPIKNLLRTIRSAGNPQMMLNQMAGQKPQLKQAMDFVNQNGGNPQQAFYQLAKEKGINPEDILKELNS